jgi:hypothetical protein
MARRFLIERRLRPHPTAVAERDREAPHLAPFAAGIPVSHRTASALLGSAADRACHGRSFLLQLSFSKTHRSQNFTRSDWPRLFTL